MTKLEFDLGLDGDVRTVVCVRQSMVLADMLAEGRYDRGCTEEACLLKECMTEAALKRRVDVDLRFLTILP